MTDAPPPHAILKNGGDTYKEKKDDYGDSWRTVGEVLQMFASQQPVTLETREDHISYGLYTRRLDKLARAFHGEFVADEMSFEPVLDSHRDEMVYAAMHATNQESREQ